MFYINEIIRVNYKCNWSCKFCNVLKTNNYWSKDVSNIEVINKIFQLTKKYNLEERKGMILSLSWWEPTLNKNLLLFIKFAKKLWIWAVQIQTNWARLFKEKDYIYKLIDAWLDEIFLAQHWWDSEVNKKLGVFYKVQDFYDWVEFLKEKNIKDRITIQLNIVVNKINLFFVYEYINILKKNHFIDIIENQISFWFVQPNWYAELNKDEVLLGFWDKELIEVDKIIKLCQNYNIFLDFHYTSPPLCILDYKEYNLEYNNFKKIELDRKNGSIHKSNLESYQFLWKEKTKLDECKSCKNNDYCLWFYKNWVDFVGKEYLQKKVTYYLNK